MMFDIEQIAENESCVIMFDGCGNTEVMSMPESFNFNELVVLIEKNLQFTSIGSYDSRSPWRVVTNEFCDSIKLCYNKKEEITSENKEVLDNIVESCTELELRYLQEQINEAFN